MSTVFNALQRLGKALMGAVAVLPVAAILMGIGYWIDPTGWGADNIIAAILIQSGSAILDNLGWVFAISIAFGLAKDSNGAAALSAFIGFATVTKLLSPESVAGYKGIGDPSELSGEAALDWASHGWAAVNGKNVLFGIIVGLLAAWTYNRFSQVKLPDFLAFFSGRRLVPIMMSLFSIVLSGVLFLLWPLLYNVLFTFGTWIQSLDFIGAGLYGVVNRLLIPTGLHHALNSIFWFDVIGINDIGKFIAGGQTIAQAADATNAASCPGIWENGTCTVEGIVGRYQAGFFPVMMFGLPGGALAIFLRAGAKRRKVVGSLMLAGALASFFTGVTEPLEFSFMFAAPLLYVAHAILTGLSVGIAAFFHWTAGFGFSAGLVDMALSARNPLAHNWWMLLVMGVVYFALYFAVFYFLIGTFNLRTPGRGDDAPSTSATSTDDAAGVDAATSGEPNDMANIIVRGLGGAENIQSLDYCSTRLRVIVKDGSKVSEDVIRQANVSGVIRPSATAVQVIVGTQVQFVHDDVARIVSAGAVAS